MYVDLPQEVDLDLVCTGTVDLAPLPVPIHTILSPALPHSTLPQPVQIIGQSAQIFQVPIYNLLPMPTSETEKMN